MSKSDHYQESFDDNFEDDDFSEFEDGFRHGQESKRRNVRRKIEDYSELRKLKRDCDMDFL